jgi:transcriptional regulator with XRE-family HTH domain
VSIGDTLAEARRQAGLTVTQVSQRTCIRETIIRGIERGDYSACGGDFYARGHIRSIARAVGADPEPLIREYDATQGAPQAITAADVFQPSTPIKLKERRRPNWSAAMVVVLAVIVGLVTYHLVSSSSSVSNVASQKAGTSGKSKPGKKPAATPSATPTTTPVAHKHPKHEWVIDLTALTSGSGCWVDLTYAATGQQIFEGIVYPGTKEHWVVKHLVSMNLGNPGAITLTVNGKNDVPADATSSPITLSIGPGTKIT